MECRGKERLGSIPRSSTSIPMERGRKGEAIWAEKMKGKLDNVGGQTSYPSARPWRIGEKEGREEGKTDRRIASTKGLPRKKD